MHVTLHIIKRDTDHVTIVFFTLGDILSSMKPSGVAVACFGVDDGEFSCDGESPKSEAQSPLNPRIDLIMAGDGHSLRSTQYTSCSNRWYKTRSFGQDWAALI